MELLRQRSFQIIRNIGLSSYFVRKLNKPDSSELKFMAYDLYLLPPSLKSCEPINSIDTRYLNQAHDFLVNSLKKALYTELYNEKWFSKPVPTKYSSFTYNHNTLKFPGKSLLLFPSMLVLHNETNTCSLKLLLASDDYSLPSPPSPLTLHNSLTDSDFLFFIRNLPENTAKSC